MAQGSNRGWIIGCAIAAVVIGGGAASCFGVFALMGYRLYQNPNVRQGLRAVGAAMDLVQEAMSAPGTDEMENAGCDEAMVFTPELLERFIRAVDPDAGVQDLPAMPMIFCVVRRGGTPPSCEATVRAYASAHRTPPAEIMVQVSGENRSGPVCDGVYAPDGTLLRETDPRHRDTFDQVGSQAPGP